MERLEFTKRDTNICKGIAILFMVLHHAIGCFYNTPEISQYNLMAQDAEMALPIVLLATVGKVCVSLLTILSGYGIAKGYIKKKPKTIKDDIKFVLSHLIQLLSICLIALVIEIAQKTFFERDFIFTYNWLGDLTNGSPFVGGWYLVSIIVYYLLTPILYKLVSKFGLISLPLSLIPCFVYMFIVNIYIKEDIFIFYLLEYVTGIYFAQKNILNIDKERDDRRYCLLSTIAVFVLIVLRIVFSLVIDYFLAISIIFFAIFCIRKNNLVSKVLCLFGKHSANIWLIHEGFVRFYKYYFGFNKFDRFIFIFIVSLIVSIIVELLKDKSGYNTFIRKIRNLLNY